MNRIVSKNQFFAILILIFATFAVYPQGANQYDDLVAALRLAAVEKDDNQRLALYDALVQKFGIAQVSGATAPAAFQGPSKWTFDQKVDPLTDKQRYFFILTADSGLNEYGESPTLFLRSDGEELELYISWGIYLGNDTDDLEYKAKYITTRIDADQSTTGLWDNSTTDKASFCSQDEVLNLVRRLGEGTKFVVRCTPYNANPHHRGLRHSRPQGSFDAIQRGVGMVGMKGGMVVQVWSG